MHQASRSNQLPPKGVTACFEYEGGMANCMFPSRELGEKLQGQRILTSPRNGRCSGKVIGADFEYIYQQSHGDTVIAHRLEQLDRAPTLHSSPVIAYSNGKGVCISAEKAKAMEMGKEKGKEMAR
jgi:hypothetical protein